MRTSYLPTETTICMSLLKNDNKICKFFFYIEQNLLKWDVVFIENRVGCLHLLAKQTTELLTFLYRIKKETKERIIQSERK